MDGKDIQDILYIQGAPDYKFRLCRGLLQRDSLLEKYLLLTGKDILQGENERKLENARHLEIRR